MKKFISLFFLILLLLMLVSCFFGSTTTTNSVDKKEFIAELKKMQSEVYNLMKQSIYDKLDGSMTYSTVQNSMDNAEKQIKTKISTFDIYLDLSNGTFAPKWICTVKLNDGFTYKLMYISVELNSSYHLKHKSIGTYNY